MTVFNRKFAVLAVGAAAALALLASAQEKQEKGGQPAVGKQAPTFTTKAMSGKEIKFPEAYKGKVVLLDFWATWCPPCRKEIPYLVKAWDKHHESAFDILGVSLDGSRRISAEKVTDFTKDKGMKWEQVYENVEALGGPYNIQFIPTAFLIDGDTGTILAMGDDLHGDELMKTVDKHVKAKVEQKSK